MQAGKWTYTEEELHAMLAAAERAAREAEVTPGFCPVCGLCRACEKCVVKQQ